MDVAITNGIKVIVKTDYQEFYSNPFDNNFAFSYKIRIENASDATFKLISRHWFIFDASGNTYQVEGEGVVGKQPIIEPGQYHEYISGCNFNAPLGQMYGYYIMERIIDGRFFKIDIPRFVMTHPALLN